VQLFSLAQENQESSEVEEDTDKAALLEEPPSKDTKMDVDDENPF
jgi:hypothetical protein